MVCDSFGASQTLFELFNAAPLTVQRSNSRPNSISSRTGSSRWQPPASARSTTPANAVTGAALMKERDYDGAAKVFATQR